MVVGSTAEMMIMINQIIKFHSGLEKGQAIKVITVLDDYSTFINRTDIIRKCNDSLLLILRANGAKVAINTDYIISCCVIQRL
jgi:hypothetical protein